jgi:hypothetical protein
MFENDVFENWLDKQANEIVVKLGEGQSLSSEEMIILVLKAQANHFAHLDQDLRKEMRDLREDMNKRFEQVDKRFDVLIARTDRFMIWSLGLTFTSTLFILGVMYKLID